MKAELRVESSGKVFMLEDFNLLGRSPQASIQIVDGSISREHASIRRQGNSYWIHDLGSANGSFINEVPVTAAQRLRDGDQLRLGFTLLTVLMEDEYTLRAPGQSSEDTQQGYKTQILKPVENTIRTQAVTLLVGDLREFSNISARMSSEDLAVLVKFWYEECRRILLDRGALIDKFIGDCVFAYWQGVEVKHRRLAVEAAKLLRESSADPDRGGAARKLLLETHHVTFDCRVGMHVGEVSMGNFSEGNFTALGDAVNLTFRIESLTRKLDEEILVSHAFVEGWEQDRPNFVDCGYHEIKGYDQLVRIHALK